MIQRFRQSDDSRVSKPGWEMANTGEDDYTNI